MESNQLIEQNPQSSLDSQYKNIDYNKNMEKEDDIEILKLRDANLHVFELPPMTSSKGHTTSDFQKLIFKGMMKMTIKGKFMYIFFLNEDNSIFIVSIVDKNYEKYLLNTDSSRYFSLRAMNPQGVPNWYGIAFKQRNGAFDFKKTLMDFKESIIFEENLKNKENQEYKPKYDLKLEIKKDVPKSNNFGKFKFGK